jgi:hypothetical protein
MVDGDCSFMIDAAAGFFDYFRVTGWFHSASAELSEVYLVDEPIGEIAGIIRLPHSGVAESLGPNKGFRIQALIEKSLITPTLSVLFRTTDGRCIKARISDLSDERNHFSEGRALLDRFARAVNGAKDTKILDIGGRARSSIEHSKTFPEADCTILDILPGEDVDVVGDAHAMSELFPPNYFDAIFSASVFEHLLMPWVVATEMSKILRIGGLAFISTHQTTGLHDQPWDFWRFSDTAWDGLFNRLSGFEILGRALEDPQFITPHYWAPWRSADGEWPVGYVASSVLIRKIAEPRLSWGPLPVSKVIDTAYPAT